MTPWAEQLRNLHLQTAEEARGLRMQVYALRVSLDVEPVAIEFATATTHLLTADELVADDRGACRAVAQRLVADGIGSIIVPSAALPGTKNLVVLAPAVEVGYDQQPVDAVDWPAAMTAQNGRCPEGLWRSVHYESSATRHAGLAAFEDGEELEFAQPDVTADTLLAA